MNWYDSVLKELSDKYINVTFKVEVVILTGIHREHIITNFYIYIDDVEKEVYPYVGHSPVELKDELEYVLFMYGYKEA